MDQQCQLTQSVGQQSQQALAFFVEHPYWQVGNIFKFDINDSRLKSFQLLPSLYGLMAIHTYTHKHLASVCTQVSFTHMVALSFTRNILSICGLTMWLLSRLP